MIRSSLLLLSLPLGAAFGQSAPIEGTGVAIEARSQIPPSVTPDVRKPK